jgi:Caspase domain/SPOR domain
LDLSNTPIEHVLETPPNAKEVLPRRSPSKPHHGPIEAWIIDELSKTEELFPEEFDVSGDDSRFHEIFSETHSGGKRSMRKLEDEDHRDSDSWAEAILAGLERALVVDGANHDGDCDGCARPMSGRWTWDSDGHEVALFTLMSQLRKWLDRFYLSLATVLIGAVVLFMACQISGYLLWALPMNGSSVVVPITVSEVERATSSEVVRSHQADRAPLRNNQVSPYFAAVREAAANNGTVTPVSAAPAHEPKGECAALLIENSDYQWGVDPTIKRDSRDVRSLGEGLKAAGFHVEVGESLTRDEMRRAIDAFNEKLRKGMTALVYFSGYGIQANRQNYLIPVDSDIWNEREVQPKSIGLDDLLAQMNQTGADIKIAIIDAARRNPFERRFRKAGSEGLAPTSAANTLILYSARAGTPGGLVNEGSSERSLFAAELQKEITGQGISAEAAFNRIRLSVSRASLSEQIPWISPSLSQEFSFSSCDRKAGPAVPSPVGGAPDVPAKAAGGGGSQSFRFGKPEGNTRTHEGWIIQVGSFETEENARQRLLIARAKSGYLLEKVDPFTEPVLKGEKTLYRARFAGFRNKEDAEETCTQLKLKDIDCMTIKQ